MKHNIVRINKIVLNNFKNVKKGIVEMPAYSGKELFSEKADVLGLYGQNGSEKPEAMTCFLAFLSSFLLHLMITYVIFPALSICRYGNLY